ncbi:MAG: FecR domain-containing protein [Rhodospirillaceae bacterium]|nr:FecR domain-containing protein [Rhodospirillaceae bacterium]
MMAGFEQRIAAWLDGRISEAESETLQQELRDSAEARTAFRLYAELDAVIRETADTQGVGTISKAGGAAPSSPKSAKSPFLKVALAIAAGIIFALTATLWIQQTNRNRKIAHVTGLNGALTWIGDGGELVQASGTSQVPIAWANVLGEDGELSGGTIEGTAAESWFELKFHDRSTAMIFGKSNLTFSDQGQKVLHLKQGRFSATVVPQPAAKPMLIHTPSAVLKVIGTQFDVEAGPESTMLYVREGKVQIRRVSDGKTVDVPADHRVVVTADSDMLLRFVGPDRAWAQTPFWENLSASGNQDLIATQETCDYDGTRNLILLEESAALPAQDTGHTLRSGDLLEIRYVWRSDKWWAAEDQVAIKFFTTDNDLMSGTPTFFATLLSGTPTADGTYQAGSGRATATETESGKKLFVAIDTQDGGGELDGVAHVDNFQLQVTRFLKPGLRRLDDFQFFAPFSDPPPAPTPTIIIGGNVRNGDFNGNDSD